jgi:hypothetical protein
MPAGARPANLPAGMCLSPDPATATLLASHELRKPSLKQSVSEDVQRHQPSSQPPSPQSKQARSSGGMVHAGSELLAASGGYDAGLWGPASVSIGALRGRCTAATGTVPTAPQHSPPTTKLTGSGAVAGPATQPRASPTLLPCSEGGRSHGQHAAAGSVTGLLAKPRPLSAHRSRGEGAWGAAPPRSSRPLSAVSGRSATHCTQTGRPAAPGASEVGWVQGQRTDRHRQLHKASDIADLAGKSRGLHGRPPLAGICRTAVGSERAVGGSGTGVPPEAPQGVHRLAGAVTAGKHVASVGREDGCGVAASGTTAQSPASGPPLRTIPHLSPTATTTVPTGLIPSARLIEAGYVSGRVSGRVGGARHASCLQVCRDPD